MLISFAARLRISFAFVGILYLCFSPHTLKANSATPLNLIIADIGSSNCAGATGFVTIVSTTGTAPFQYAINGGPFSNFNTFTNLAPGIYTIDVQDAAGCTGTISIGISGSTAPDGQVTGTTPISCPGASDGGITVVGVGGTPPYSFSIDGVNFFPTGVFTGLSAGYYVITVDDGNGCLGYENVTLIQPDTISGQTIAQLDVDCFGNSTGTITIGGTGGTAPYLYSIDGVNFFISGTFSGLSAGNYTFTIEDVNGCQGTYDATITEPAILTGSIVTQTPATCNGNTDGTVTLTGVGGTTPYEYSLNGTTYFISGTFTGLAANTYTFFIRDIRNCMTTINVTITEPPVLSGSIASQTNVTCNGGSDGAVTITPSGGTGPYEYSSDGITFQTSPTLAGLAANAYVITVRDANNCTSPVNVNISEPTLLTLTISNQVNNLCNGDNSGSVTLFSTGGVPTYQFSIDGINFSTNPNFQNLAAGPYTVTVEDMNNCTNTVPVTITEPTAITASATNITHVDCNGASTGSFTIAGSGGNTSGYMYSLDGINFQTNGTFTGLSAGSYTLTIEDSDGCQGNTTVVLAEPIAISVATNNLVNASCNGDMDGSATLSGMDGTAPYSYSLDGITFVPTAVFNNLAAGTYTGFIEDANGCNSSIPFVITEPPSMGISIVNQTNIDCGGNANGTVDIIGIGGMPGYDYAIDGGPFSPGGSFIGLAAGPYTFTVRDANNCTYDSIIVITEPSPVLGIVLSQTNLGCNGISTGTFTIDGSGGTSPYQFSLDGVTFSPSGTFSGLPAGTYTVTVADNNSCSNTVSVTLTEPQALTIAIDSSFNVLCNGSSTGAVYLSGAGGIAPYSFSQDGVNFFPSGDFLNLPAGAYTFIIRDDNNCEIPISTTLTEPTALSAAPNAITDVQCNGTATGSGNVTASGGTGPYTYSWSPGGFTAQQVDTLLAGTYNIQVVDANGCMTNATLIIGEPSLIQTGVTLINDISCNGASDGSASLSITGGIAPYSFLWAAGTTSGMNVNNLPAGTHFVTVTDASGCQVIDSVIVTEPAPIQILLSQTDATCFGAEDGTASAMVSGGTSPYSYSWNTTPISTSLAATNLDTGTFVITVTDNNGCVESNSVVINQPQEILLNTAFSNETCSDSNGVASVVATGGAGPFSFSWNTTPPQTSDVAVGLTAGVYIVTATDITGCSASENVTIMDETAPEIAIDQLTAVSCFGLSDGSVSVIASGGTGSYSYSWNIVPAQTGPTLNALAAGSYEVIVFDGQCTSTLTIIIPEPDSLTASVDNFTVPLCTGNFDGTATVTPAGGTAPYSYQWNTNPIQSSATAQGLSAGTFQVSVTDDQGCTATATITLTDPLPLTISVPGTNVLCAGENNGTATALVGGGTPPYAYSWSNGSPNATILDLPAGAYQVQVTDSHGCVITDDVTLTEPPALFLTTSIIDVACFGGSDGRAEAFPSGGTPGYTYEWSNGSRNAVSNNLTQGDYEVIVRDQNGCKITEEITIHSPDSITIDLIDATPAFCNEPNGTARVLASGGTPDYEYSWNTSPPQSGPSVVNIFGDSLGGPYVVTVTDSRGCEQIHTIEIQNQPPAFADFTTNQDSIDILLSQATIQFVNQSENDVVYLWDFGDGSGPSDRENPSHTYTKPGMYTVSLIVFDQNFSCPDTATLMLNIIPDGKVFIPNAFSPNGDGINDDFYLKGEGIISMRMTIFDRWGKEIITLENPSDKWDGYHIDGQPLQEGVYAYLLVADLNQGYRLKRGGTITLVR